MHGVVADAFGQRWPAWYRAFLKGRGGFKIDSDVNSLVLAAYIGVTERT